MTIQIKVDKKNYVSMLKDVEDFDMHTLIQIHTPKIIHIAEYNPLANKKRHIYINQNMFVCFFVFFCNLPC